MTWPILPPSLQPKLDTFFWYIALPEFGRYSKWTHVWMDLSLLCKLLIKTIWWRQKWWRHKWLNGSRLQRRKNTTLDGKELNELVIIPKICFIEWVDKAISVIKFSSIQQGDPFKRNEGGETRLDSSLWCQALENKIKKANDSGGRFFKKLCFQFYKDNLKKFLSHGKLISVALNVCWRIWWKHAFI